jgi:uncharacterized protein YuzE
MKGFVGVTENNWVARGSDSLRQPNALSALYPTDCIEQRFLDAMLSAPKIERICMKVAYDPNTDTLTVIFKEDTAVAESDEEKRGVILDYDEQGNLVSLEILDASKRVTLANRIEFEAVEASAV